MNNEPAEINELDYGLGCLITVQNNYTDEQEFSQILEHVSKILSVNEKYIYLILDYSKTSVPNFDMEYMYKLAQQSIKDFKFNPNLVVAINANDDITFGFANIWNLFVKEIGWEVAVFRKKELSKQWLDKEMKKRYDLTKLTFN